MFVTLCYLWCLLTVDLLLLAIIISCVGLFPFVLRYCFGVDYLFVWMLCLWLLLGLLVIIVWMRFQDLCFCGGFDCGLRCC